jgi:nucleoid DNA-binding protein
MKNRLDLIRLASRESGFTKGDMEIALDAFIKTAKKIVKDGEELNIMGFGKMWPETVPAHKLHDLNNGGFMEVPESKRIKVRISELFKAEVNSTSP